jgi:hypothetical protein
MTKLLTAVTTMPNKMTSTVVGRPLTAETRISNSGIKPLVPGNPTLAKIKNPENSGIVPRSPEKAVIALVWYRSDRAPTKKNKADDIRPWLNIKNTAPPMPTVDRAYMPMIAKLI